MRRAGGTEGGCLPPRRAMRGPPEDICEQMKAGVVAGGIGAAGRL